MGKTILFDNAIFGQAKVLTMWEPYASLFIANEKIFETRPKPTNWRGIYLIHAAKVMKKEQREICQTEPFASALTRIGIKDYRDFTLGAIIGSAKMDFCYHIHNTDGFPSAVLVMKAPEFTLRDHLYKTTNEYAFGDFGHGRSAWKMSDKQFIENPICYKNGQGYYLPFKTEKLR